MRTSCVISSKLNGNGRRELEPPETQESAILRRAAKAGQNDQDERGAVIPVLTEICAL
jgi:hypothetical protein